MPSPQTPRSSLQSLVQPSMSRRFPSSHSSEGRSRRALPQDPTLLAACELRGARGGTAAGHDEVPELVEWELVEDHELVELAELAEGEEACSRVQAEEQPSPGTAFPSSHSSPISRMPLPQGMERARVRVREETEEKEEAEGKRRKGAGMEEREGTEATEGTEETEETEEIPALELGLLDLGDPLPHSRSGMQVPT